MKFSKVERRKPYLAPGFRDVTQLITDYEYGEFPYTELPNLFASGALGNFFSAFITPSNVPQVHHPFITQTKTVIENSNYARWVILKIIGCWDIKPAIF